MAIFFSKVLYLLNNCSLSIRVRRSNCFNFLVFKGGWLLRFFLLIYILQLDSFYKECVWLFLKNLLKFLRFLVRAAAESGAFSFVHTFFLIMHHKMVSECYHWIWLKNLSMLFRLQIVLCFLVLSPAIIRTLLAFHFTK